MNCYLCNSKHFKKRDGKVRDRPDLNILECNNCNLVFLDNIEHINDDVYENSGMHGTDLLSIESWLKETEKDDQRRINILKNEIYNKKILDFGSGAGGFLLKAQKIAKQAEGVELEKRVLEYWKNKLKIYGDVEEVKSNYDLITAFHVIEHLIDPRSMLTQLGSKLDKNGKIFLEVPNSNDILLSLYTSNFKDFTYWSKHLFLFNADTLNTLANQAGFKVLAVKQYQRYPLSNHLFWLSEKRPGGHIKWSFLDTPELNSAYSNALASIGKCDTIFAYLEKY
jgi:2-polyprenyl-3-methyl-5-hydroxy-6-metoxy-1,4-benzoquinol methylase